MKQNQKITIIYFNEKDNFFFGRHENKITPEKIIEILRAINNLEPHGTSSVYYTNFNLM